jgi:hypothetical protein
MGYVFTIEKNEAVSTYYEELDGQEVPYQVDESTFHVFAERFGETPKVHTAVFTTRDAAARHVGQLIELHINPTTKPSEWKELR